MDDLAPPLVPLQAPHGEDNRDPHHDGEWLTIDAAACRLGVTTTAIRNRIKRGTLETRPNGNYGKLVRAPLTMSRTVSLTPRDPAGATVPLTSEASIPITVILTVLSDHVQTLKAALAKAEAELELLRQERERAERLEVEVAVVPELRVTLRRQEETLRALEAALESEQGRLAEVWAERGRMEVKAAVVPGMQATIEALRTELESEQGRLAELWAERDQLLNRSWWRRLVG